METEYLDTVNKELLDIEHFFQSLYASSSLPPPYTPGILPLLKPATTTSHSSFAESSSLHSGLGSFTLGSDAGVPEVDMDHLAADLRARYKQLKVVQDRLHIELTKLHVWKQQQQTRQANQSEPTNKKKCQEQPQPAAALASALASTSGSGSGSGSSASSSSCGVTTRSSATQWTSAVTLIALFIALAIGICMYLDIGLYMMDSPESRSPLPQVLRACPRSFRHDSYPWPRH
ncbi:hypothetical protein BGZ75_007122 [Mortierella antarctica]|nr:hypothetical protein BGZ75_007122 [Mortierella antarctica]